MRKQIESFTILHLDAIDWQKNLTDIFCRHKIGFAVILDLGRLTHDLHQLLSYYYVHMCIITHKIFSEVASYKKTLHKYTSQLLVIML